MSTIPPQKIRVTEDEMARLGSNATNGRFLTCPYGVDAVLNIPSNDWALQLLAEWRGLVPRGGTVPVIPPPEEVLPQADLSEHMDTVARAGLTWGLNEAAREAEREAARLEVIAKALMLTHYSPLTPTWESLTHRSRAVWLEKARTVLDHLNAVDNP